MGYGSYSHEAHVAATSSRAALPAQQVFRQRGCHALMDPKGVRVRECRDAADHPASLGIVFALDVTGSMGGIPVQLAQKELPHFMAALQHCGVRDPQILFMAIGDATCDRSPLQVGQFESTAELMDQWLTWSHLEGGGGGTFEESYELGMYFLAEHTAMDCWEKRQHRGYAFFTGDEHCYPAVSHLQVEALVGDGLDADIPVADVVAALQVRFEPFFLIPDLQRRVRCEAFWRRLLGDHVIAMEDTGDTCYVAAGLVALCEGVVRDLDALAALLPKAGVARERVGPVVRALTPFAATLPGAVAHPPLVPSGEKKGLLSMISDLANGRK